MSVPARPLDPSVARLVEALARAAARADHAAGQPPKETPRAVNDNDEARRDLRPLQL